MRNLRIPSRPNSDEILFGDCRVLTPTFKIHNGVQSVQVMSYLVRDKVVSPTF